jgi:UDP-N-acetyl-D-mannosaminuronic acid transferase (WecB/TagA/CpsF family)
VTNIWQDGNHAIHVSILLKEMDGLPKDSKFTIRNKDLLDKALYVTLGKSKQYFSKSDKIVGEIETLFYIKKREI